MSDNRRDVTGRISIANDPDVASTAYQMAKDLWMEEHHRSPKLSEPLFLDLVKYCALALKGEMADTPIGKAWTDLQSEK